MEGAEKHNQGLRSRAAVARRKTMTGLAGVRPITKDRHYSCVPALLSGEAGRACFSACSKAPRRVSMA